MKRLLLVVCFFFSVWAFAGPKQRGYQTECVAPETVGYVSINIWNTIKPLKYKLKHAQKDAIHALLFSGYAAGNTCSTIPAMLRTNEERTHFEKVEKQFFSRWGKWRMFVRSASLKSSVNNTPNDRLIYTVSISKNDLRKYLEDNNIIQKLNSGF